MFPFDESSENGQAPEQARFLEVKVEPWPDSKRVRVYINLSPFKQRPNIDVIITTETGHEVGSATIIETMTPRLVFTMHLRTDDLSGLFILKSVLTYPDLGIVDRASIPFNVNQNLEK